NTNLLTVLEIEELKCKISR
ncbi:hypothetical protein MTO96_044436, partial [Rhipicephalus appendiculatus]